MDGMRPRMAHVGAALLLRLHLGRRGQRCVMVALLRHRDQSRGAVGGHEQRLGARAEDAVPPLQLGAVDGEVGLVDQLVRVRAVLRIAGDADRDGCADRLAGRLDVERALRNGPANAFRDLHRLLRRCLRQQDRELLAAEARGHVVVAQLRAEHLGDPFQDRVAGKMAVRVVDVAEQVEVGHDQRHRPLEALRPAQLLLHHDREVAGVVQPGLRIDPGLGLKLRDRE